MNLIEPSYSLFTSTGEPLTEAEGIRMLKWIEANARISHRSEEAQTEDSWRRFITAVVLEHGDWSVVEHASINIRFRVDRGICMEIRTHRIASYTMESTRFVNYSKEKNDLEFVAPIGYDEKHDDYILWRDSIAKSEHTYMTLVKRGWAPQMARSVLPNDQAATISMTSNLRNLRYFLLARSSRGVHPELRKILDKVLVEVQQKIPLLFDDIEVGVRQIDNFRKAR